MRGRWDIRLSSFAHWVCFLILNYRGNQARDGEVHDALHPALTIDHSLPYTNRQTTGYRLPSYHDAAFTKYSAPLWKEFHRRRLMRMLDSASSLSQKTVNRM